MGKTRAGRFALRGQRMALLHLETMTQAVDSADSVDPRALEALNRYFGYDSFRPGQSGIVSAIFAGHDVLGVMPTGAGKSICYQIPAAILPGVAIVISPLISLMRDQVDALNDVGLPAAFINTTQTPDEQDLVFAQALSGQIKLLYVAPERLETERFRNFAVRVPISLVAVDEAHCVSQWGQDFRSSYLGIGEFIAGLPTRPTVAAFTATATERVRRDIVSILGLHTPSITVTGFDRPNLYFDVISMPRKDKASWVASYIASHPDESGIVYCATRKETEALAESLNSAVAELRAAGGADVSDIGTIAVAYHGGMSADAREKAQRDFVTDRVPVVVATNAFGMGIDKSNVRFVIHYQMPRSMEAYYQEAGRAGRDGEAAECILLYNGSDIFTAKWMIEHTEPNENMTAAEQSAVRYQDMNRLNRMVDYCTKPGCLRAFILRYFGENAAQDCRHCSACCGARYGEAEEIARQRRRGADGAHLGQQATAEKVGSIGKIEAPAGGDLFEQLRQVRMALAKLHHVPPYIICNDATLTEMVRRKPETLEGMRSVSGMGEIKTARYGEAFLGVIRPYVAQERKMKANVKLLAERAQSAAFRNPVRTAPKPMPPKPVYTPPPAPVIPDIDWDNLSDPEVLSDAYLSGLTIREMSQKSGLSESWLREKLRSMDLIF